MKKRWLFLIIILVVVAVVLAIVFVNLFKDKDTRDLAKNVNSVTQNGYLSKDDKTNQLIDEYLNSLMPLSGLSDEKEKIEFCVNAYAAFEVAGEFFNSQIVFTKYTDTYKKNWKNIQNNFNKAQDAANNLWHYLNENGEKIGDNLFWQERTWTDCKGNVENLINFTGYAFEGLIEVYHDSVSSKLTNNALSNLIFDQFKSMFKTNDQQQSNGIELCTFANAYFSADGQELILEYSYDDQLQKTVKDIQENGTQSEFYAQFIAGKLGA